MGEQVLEKKHSFIFISNHIQNIIHFSIFNYFLSFTMALVYSILLVK